MVVIVDFAEGWFEDDARGRGVDDDGRAEEGDEAGRVWARAV